MSTLTELPSPPSDVVSATRFSPSNGLLAVSSWDQTISIYQRNDSNAESPFTLTRRIKYRAPVLDFCWGSDDSTIYSVGLDHDVRSVSLQDENVEQTVLSSHEAASNKIAYSSEHDVLLSTSWDATLHIHTPSNGSFIRVRLPAKPFALSQTSERAVVAMAERKVSVYDLKALKMLVEQAGSTANGTGPNQAENVLEVAPWQQRESSLKFMTRAVACMPNGLGFAVSSIEGRVGVEWFDPEAQEKTYAFKCHRQTTTTNGPETGEEAEVDVVYPVNALAFHPAYGTFATGGGDGVVSVWDAESKRRVKHYQKVGASVASLAFSGDGTFLAVGLSPGFEDGMEEEEMDPNQVKVLVKRLAEGEVKGKPAKAAVNGEQAEGAKGDA